MTIELTKLNPAEKSRTYTFPGGEKITLEKVTHFLARESGTHRLQTEDGKLHIVPVGWLHVEIDAGSFTV
jgi:hypothetical protein